MNKNSIRTQAITPNPFWTFILIFEKKHTHTLYIYIYIHNKTTATTTTATTAAATTTTKTNTQSDKLRLLITVLRAPQGEEWPESHDLSRKTITRSSKLKELVEHSNQHHRIFIWQEKTLKPSLRNRTLIALFQTPKLVFRELKKKLVQCY